MITESRAVTPTAVRTTRERKRLASCCLPSPIFLAIMALLPVANIRFTAIITVTRGYTMLFADRALLPIKFERKIPSMIPYMEAKTIIITVGKVKRRTLKSRGLLS